MKSLVINTLIKEINKQTKKRKNMEEKYWMLILSSARNFRGKQSEWSLGMFFISASHISASCPPTALHI